MRSLNVAELNLLLRTLLENEPLLGDLWVLGEVSNFKRHAASGHCYFSLKHDKAVMRAVMFKTQAQRLTFMPRDGDLVLTHGRISLYEASGDVQLYADDMQPAGVGLYQAQMEELRKRLDAEGLFGRKRQLPVLPRTIGIATAPGGAALRDMLNILARRYPLAEVLIAPCLVQGERAPDSIIEALYTLYGCGVDLVILARGGGSIEDLWSFNDEAVARALFASPVPTITGVGHETDTTIVDYVADLRAPTPSAAAEQATPELAALAYMAQQARQRLDQVLTDGLAQRREDLAGSEQALRRLAPRSRLARDRQDIDELLRRMTKRLEGAMALRGARLRGLNDQLNALSPQATMERGYSVVRRSSDGKIISAAAQLSPGDELQIRFAEGQAPVKVIEPQG
jgi:exodeoxyribonuclease VII large subunit